jgi:hypothetical protein
MNSTERKTIAQRESDNEFSKFNKEINELDFRRIHKFVA